MCLFLLLLLIVFYSKMQITREEVATAATLMEDERSIRYAARAIMKPETMVCRALQKFRETQTYTRRPASGRPRATWARDDRFLTLQSLRYAINKEGLNLRDCKTGKRTIGHECFFQTNRDFVCVHQMVGTEFGKEEVNDFVKRLWSNKKIFGEGL